ncbi:MAG TPA: SDR family NAD(P)-dependent oxidoreductase [Methylomirabilota bacterium]|nr:SDR family NAD(P)-dependent oxidoreductase [Methylomirabilota bacterium]
MNRLDFAGRNAIVTGGAQGIGAAIVKRLEASGAKVSVWDLDGSPRVDVSDPASIQNALKNVGKIDVLVNNAGITGRSYPTWELTDDDWHQVIAVDLTAVFLVCRAAVRVMLRRGRGRIVNIASIAGKEGNPTLVPYSSAKAGVIGLTKALAKEVATRGIFVNAVAPAVIGTELLQQMTKATVDMLIAKIPMGRVGRPEEVAALVAWLASDECSFSTGAVYDLSGGRATY